MMHMDMHMDPFFCTFLFVFFSQGDFSFFFARVYSRARSWFSAAFRASRLCPKGAVRSLDVDVGSRRRRCLDLAPAPDFALAPPRGQSEKLGNSMQALPPKKHRELDIGISTMDMALIITAAGAQGGCEAGLTSASELYSALPRRPTQHPLQFHHCKARSMMRISLRVNTHT